jgi:hypothetical protein
VLSTATVALKRTKMGNHAKAVVAIGLRGVGKTVLLRRLYDVAEEIGCATSFIEAVEGKPLAALLAPELRRIILDLDRAGAVHTAVKRALGVLRSFVAGVKFKQGEFEIGLDIAPETGTADSGVLTDDLPPLFVAIGKAAAARGTAIAIFIDEMQYLTENDLSALITALHRVAQSNLPIICFGAGLPQIIAQMGNSKSYAERMFDFPELGPLDREEAMAALDLPARQAGGEFTTGALAAIVDRSLGYPYFLQEWGYHAWNEADGPVITAADVAAADPGVIEALDRSFFRTRLERSTPAERDYLRAMAELGPGPHKSGDIAHVLGRRTGEVGPRRGKLIEKGMIYAPSYGETAFTVPLFDEYLRRTMPNWSASTAQDGKD